MARKAHHMCVERVGSRPGYHRPVVLMDDQRATRQALGTHWMREEDRHQIGKHPLLLTIDEKRKAEIAGDARQTPELLPVGRADRLVVAQPVEDEGGGYVGHLAVARPRAGVDPLVKPEID